MATQLFILLLQWLVFVSAEAAVETADVLPGCPSKCGKIHIPYPFGIGRSCSIDDWAIVDCDTSSSPPKATLKGFQLIEILSSAVRVKSVIYTKCYDKSGTVVSATDSSPYSVSFSRDDPYTFSTKNKLIIIGCNTAIAIDKFSEHDVLPCASSSCHNRVEMNDSSCDCCRQSSILHRTNDFLLNLTTLANNTKIRSSDPCDHAFLAEQDHYLFQASQLTDNTTSLQDIPMLLNFGVGLIIHRDRDTFFPTCIDAEKQPETYACKDNSYCYASEDSYGYLCNCSDGYHGNPYLAHGCQDVDECADQESTQCMGNCTNTIGGYICSCPRDSTGDGWKNGTGCSKRNKPLPVQQLTSVQQPTPGGSKRNKPLPVQQLTPVQQPTPGGSKRNKHILVIHLTSGIGFLLLFVVVGACIYQWIKRRKLFKLKQQFFQHNGGLLLKDKISSCEGSVKSTKIFTAEELKSATNNYDKHQILGQGGSGTVYKGFTPNLGTVAIKKSKTIDESQVGQFINEVVILTQIYHRHVVKLLGCCLETEVPLLVYEFVSNGTLYHHIHQEGRTRHFISWENRLRIAAEVAGALAYLHSATSIPIIHRDVKSANILLDDNFTAKVADFGASRLNPLDQTQINTLVQGTMGYLDPEYFHTGMLTEKSDVYSFGVVLAELLTGEKAISIERPEKQRTLATYFIAAMKENCISKLLEVGIVNEGNAEQVHAVAELATRCLNLKSEKRPSMKEVAAELERLRDFERHSRVQQSNEESISLAYGHVDPYDTPSGSYTGDASGQYSLERDMMQSMNSPR